MARIRSIHPGIWTDVEFVSVSSLARLFFIGIWNECDDQGIFPWSPLQLKMRILPADNVNADDLLRELQTTQSIMRFEVNGKAYGAVRNFTKFQRPKKPTNVHPSTSEIRNFVCGNAGRTEGQKAEIIAANDLFSSESDGDENDGDGEAVGNQFPTGGEISPQMEEGGDKGRGENPPTPLLKSKPDKVSLPDWVPKDEWRGFVAMRQKLKKPMTDRAIGMIIRKLDRMRSSGEDVAKVLDQSTMRCWQDLYPVKADQAYADTEAKFLGPC